MFLSCVTKEVSELLCDDPLVKQLNINYIKLATSLHPYRLEKTIISFYDNFSIYSFTELNIDFPLNLRANFPFVTQLWAVKSVSLMECLLYVFNIMKESTFLLTHPNHLAVRI